MDFLQVLVNLFSQFIGLIVRFINNFISGLATILSFLSYLVSILKTLFYAATTLFSKVLDLTAQIFNGSLFSYIVEGFNYLETFIGYGGALFFSTLFFVVIVRIGIAFVFKIFRLNLDYKRYVHK